MSSAAEAIMGATPPPPRPAAGKAAAPTNNAPSFDDHLAAETKAPEAPLVSPTSESGSDAQAASDAPTEASAKPDGAKESDAKTPDTPAVLPTAQADAPAPAIIIQLIAQGGGETVQAPAAPIEGAEAVEATSPATPTQPTAPNTNPQPDSFGKTLAKAETRETLPAQPASMPGSALLTASVQTDEAAIAAEPEAATPPVVQQAIAQQAMPPSITPAKPANKSAPTDASSEAAESDAGAPADTAATQPATPTRASEPRTVAPAVEASAPPTNKTELETPKVSAKSEDSSVQEKLAAVLENDAPQPQAKINSDRVVVTAPAPDAANTMSAPDLALPPVGAIGDARATTPTSPLVAADHAAAATRTAPAGAQVAREIVRRFDGDTTKFEMRLDPPELGRVEVRMEVTRDHKVTAVLAADSPQTLTELARHARELEQTLQSAGLELAENGLSFDLRQGGDDASQSNSDEGPRLAASESEIEDSAPLARPIGLERWRGVRVDVMA